MSVADIHVRSARFQAGIRQRNWREHIVAALLVVVFGWIAWITPDLIMKAGAVLSIIGLIYISVLLGTRARAGNARDLAAAKTWVAFYRGELQRQQEALQDIWSWYLAPLVPGMIVIAAGAAFTSDNPAPLFVKITLFVLVLLFCAAVFGFVYWINRRAARQLKSAIDKLDAAQES
jgi:predicted membrane chloride channel (bestrophin family)